MRCAVPPIIQYRPEVDISRNLTENILLKKSRLPDGQIVGILKQVGVGTPRFRSYAERTASVQPGTTKVIQAEQQIINNLLFLLIYF